MSYTTIYDYFLLPASVPASPPPPSGSCSSSPKPSCYTRYGCGRGPNTLTDKGRWRGGDDITRKFQQRRPKPIAATCARQQNENNQDTKQSSQKTQSVGGSYGRWDGSGHK